MFTNCTLADSGLVVKPGSLVVHAFLIWHVSRLLYEMCSISHSSNVDHHLLSAKITAEKYAVTIDYGYRDAPGKIAIADSVLKMHCSDVVSSI